MIQHLTNLIHEIQKERGLSVLYLCNENTPLSLIENQQQAVTELLTHDAFLSPAFITECQDLVSVLHETRQQQLARVQSRVAIPSEILQYYTKQVIVPLLDVLARLGIKDKNIASVQMNSFMQFMQWKERIGLERAIGSQALSWQNDGDALAKLKFIIDEEDAYERFFLSMSSADIAEKIKDLQRNNPIIRKINNLKSSLIQAHKAADIHFTPEEWFSLLTLKMDIMHTLTALLVDRLQTVTDTEGTPYPLELEPALQPYKNLLRKLPLFMGLNGQDLTKLLDTARLVKLKKNQPAFTEGEKSTRLYIVLQGWVKLCKLNSEGDESIIGLHTIGESLLEASLVEGTHYPVSAVAVGQTTLLSVSLDNLRAALKSSPVFSANVLQLLAQRSDQLMTHFEHITLKTVQQRVGWFMLHLFLQHGGKESTLHLPVDKSLIASFLGMKPETFSRTLQQMREAGFEIERDSFKMPHLFALCEFCDAKLNKDCKFHKTKDCPNPQYYE